MEQLTEPLSLLIGLLAIAIVLFMSGRSISGELSRLRERLAGLEGISGDLSTIRERLASIEGTADKIFFGIQMRLGELGGTIERQLENLGTVKISAQPGVEETVYLVEVQERILKEGPFYKLTKETGLSEKEVELFGREVSAAIVRPTTLRVRLPSTDPVVCTEFMTYLVKWLDSTYLSADVGSPQSLNRVAWPSGPTVGLQPTHKLAVWQYLPNAFKFSNKRGLPDRQRIWYT